MKRLVLLLVLCTPLARAADAPDKEAAPEDPKVKATAFALPHPTVDESTMVEIMRTIEAGLKKNPRLEMKELDTRLADFANETPTDEIEAARGAMRDGQQALDDRKVTVAVQKLEQAVSGLAKVLPYIKKQELADAMALLAVARMQAGDKKGGHNAFIELLTWRPDYLYEPGRLPAEFSAAFDESVKQVEKARKMAVQINSEPPGAQSYVDGKYVGITPCTADAQPVGRHFITFKREGYKKAVTPVDVTKRADAVASIVLERSDKYLLVEQARTKVEATLGEEVIDSEAESLRAVLFIDHGVFVKAVAGGGSKVDVDAWLYDMRTRHLLSHVHQTVQKGNIDGQVSPLAGNLYTNVNYEGELVAPADAPPPPSLVKPWYKTWWFWTALGAGVVVAGGAVGTYYGINALQAASCDSTAHCVSFQP